MYLYLFKKISIPGVQKLTSVDWNQFQDWIACGGDNGLLKVLKLDSGSKPSESTNQATTNVLSMNQTLEGHSGCVTNVTWNSGYQKMTSCDDSGHIIVWKTQRGMWYEDMNNNRSQSFVVDLKWSSDGQKICITYEDGVVTVGSVSGGKLWEKHFEYELKLSEWAPDLKTMLFVTKTNLVKIHDTQGNYIADLPLSTSGDKDGASIIGLHWYNGDHGFTNKSYGTLAIAFIDGRVQIMRDEHDKFPIIVGTGLELSVIKWNHNGSILAVGGIDRLDPKLHSKILFFTPTGDHLRTLQLTQCPGQPIESIAWRGNGLNLVIATGPILFFATIVPDFKWTYFSNCLVYSYNSCDRSDTSIMFYNILSKEKSVKYTANLYGICSFGEVCCLFTSANEPGTYGIIICNTIGSPIETKYLTIEPRFYTMTQEYIICANDSKMYIWSYAFDVSQYGAGGGQGRETVISIDEGLYSQTNDPICAITSTNNLLVAGRVSGICHCYTLPHGHLERKVVLDGKPEKLKINCDGTKLAVIDNNGICSIYNLSIQDKPEGEHMNFSEKEVWDFHWATDNPDMFALMEKRRLYIYRDLKAEEPLQCNSYICEFKDLQVTCLNLESVYDNPEEPEELVLMKYETISLRDARTMLGTINLSDSYRYIEDHSHPRLWRLLAEESLKKLEFTIADKSFVQCRDYSGVMFVKKLKLMTDVRMQRAEVAVYLEQFEEAETLYKDMDRIDLALDLRCKLGDWFNVVQILNKPENSKDELLNFAYNKIGDSFVEKQQYRFSVRYYTLAHNIEALVQVYYILEEYDKLSQLIKDIPDGSPILKDLAIKFHSVGMCQQATEVYLKMQDIKSAIDCCVLLNQWKKAVELAETHQFPQIESLLAKYAAVLQKDGTTQGTFSAIELFRKANKATESAGILADLAMTAANSKVNPVRAKQLFVLAGLQMEEFRMKTLDNTTTVGLDTVTATAVTLDLLVTQDTSTQSKKVLEKHWKGAEAYHFLILTYKQLYRGELNLALYTAYRLTQYDDVLDKKEIYSLLAFISYHCKYFGICSDAFMNLESLDGISDEERKTYQDLARDIFTIHPPINPEIDHSSYLECPKHCGTYMEPWLTECSNCRAKFQFSMATGGNLPNDDRITMSVFKCNRCRHKAEKKHLKGFTYCPFCHGTI